MRNGLESVCRSRRVWVSAAFFMLLPAGELLAAASGRFSSHGFGFDIHDAYSFWGKTSSPSDGTVIRVAVSDSEFNAELFESFYDRGRALKALVDEKTALVFFEFEPSGNYHGLSYYFGPGNGCGYCFESAIQSTVRASQGRLKGHLSFQSERRSFDVDLDVPVPPKESGKPLPRDGGDVGKAYLAFQAAFEARNHKALFPLLDAEGKDTWKKQEKEKKLDGYLDSLWKERHLELKDAEVTGGFLRGDRSVLFIRGKNSYASLEGEALMRLEDGGWRVHFELFHLAD